MNVGCSKRLMLYPTQGAMTASATTVPAAGETQAGAPRAVGHERQGDHDERHEQRELVPAQHGEALDRPEQHHAAKRGSLPEPVGAQQHQGDEEGGERL